MVKYASLCATKTSMHSVILKLRSNYQSKRQFLESDIFYNFKILACSNSCIVLYECNIVLIRLYVLVF